MVVYLRDKETHKNYWEAEIYNNDIHCYLYSKNYFDKLIDLFGCYHEEFDKWYNYIEYLSEYRGEIFEHRLYGKSITTEQIRNATLEDMQIVATELGLKIVTD